MRKLFVPTLAAVMFVMLLFPRVAAGQGMPSSWNPQIFFGFSIARLKLDNPGTLTNDGRTGLSAGISLGFPIASAESAFCLRVQAFVTQKGATISDSVVQQKIKLTYVDVAGLIEIRIPPRINGERITLLAGPVFNITTSAQAIVNTTPADIGEVTENYDYGYLVGAEFTAIRKYLVMQVAWMPGFKKIFTSAPNNARNQTLLIMFAPKFGR
jgi:hypothetical protein